MKGPKPKSIAERFWSKVDRRGPNECWPWKAHVNKKTGYGQFCPSRLVSPMGAHRFCWMLVACEVLSEFDLICHRCDNRACCNPDHLYKGDALSNMRDMIERGRMWHPPKLRGSESPSAKLTDEQATLIRQFHKAGIPGSHLARYFGVGRTTISRIVHNKGYVNVS